MNIDLKQFSKKYNVSFQKVQAHYPEALKTAQDMGMDKEEDYVEETLKDLLDIEESANIEKLADMFIETKEPPNQFIEEIVSTGIPQSLRPERIVKNAYNFPNDEWNKSKNKRDVFKYKKVKEAEPEADSVPRQIPIVVSNY